MQMYHRDLQRDFTVAESAGVTICYPYLDAQVISYGLAAVEADIEANFKSVVSATDKSESVGLSEHIHQVETSKVEPQVYISSELLSSAAKPETAFLSNFEHHDEDEGMLRTLPKKGVGASELPVLSTVSANDTHVDDPPPAVHQQWSTTRSDSARGTVDEISSATFDRPAPHDHVCPESEVDGSDQVRDSSSAATRRKRKRKRRSARRHGMKQNAKESSEKEDQDSISVCTDSIQMSSEEAYAQNKSELRRVAELIGTHSHLPRALYLHDRLEDVLDVQ